MNLDFISVLLEAEGAGPRIPHPEDAIFGGLSEVNKYLTGIEQVIQNPASTSIKWDGGIALFFGYTPGGEFFVSDKYMYPAGFYARSPADWQKYDTQVKASRQPRPDLYPKIELIWDGLRAAVTEQAVFKGDLMALGAEMTPNGKAFVFKPTTVTYTVPVKSPMGSAMEGKVAMIVVHSKGNAPWDGVSGLTNAGDVAVIGPMGMPAGQKSKPFTLNEPTRILKNAKRAVAAEGPRAEQFLAGLDGVSKAKIQTYFNKQITGQTKDPLDTWLSSPESNTKPGTIKKLVGDGETGYLTVNAEGYQALADVWNAMYQLKNSIADQLEKQVAGFTQSINGQPGGEGFVSNTPGAGLIKLVNRGVFGGAHFNK
jgi:hypothetical protein